MSALENKIPLKPGYYWAKWRIASDDTPEDECDYLPSDRWEIVEVNDNGGEPGTLEELSVSLCGVAVTQWRDCFVWGDFVAPLERTEMVSDQLGSLANDAFSVLNWARRMGFNRERQIAELIKTFEVSLGLRAAITQSNGE